MYVLCEARYVYILYPDLHTSADNMEDAYSSTIGIHILSMLVIENPAFGTHGWESHMKPLLLP